LFWNGQILSNFQPVFPIPSKSLEICLYFRKNIYRNRIQETTPVTATIVPAGHPEEKLEEVLQKYSMNSYSNKY